MELVSFMEEVYYLKYVMPHAALKVSLKELYELWHWRLGHPFRKHVKFLVSVDVSSK